jgi:TRAP-type C4-dicarboxylate transport system permease small subunit
MSVAAAGEIARAAARPSRAVARIERAMRAANRLIVVPCMLALLLAAALLTVSVVARYFLHAPTDWQEETSVLLLVGATFLSGAYVQEQRGHVAIDVLSSVLPPRLNRVRRFLADLVSGLFCAFFAWKSWTLFHEAWVEGQTSNSTFAPPMWIPYGLMAAGMTLLTLQIAVQLLCLSPAPPPTEAPAHS